MRFVTWVKMLSSGAVLCIGGPALVWYVTPTEEEIVSRYNPELRKRSLEKRQERQEDFDKFVGKLKEYSKSDKPVWTAWEEDGERRRREAFRASQEAKQLADAAAQQRRDEIRNSIK